MQIDTSQRGSRVIPLLVYAFTCLWAAFVLYGTLTPMPALPGPPRSDLIVHFAVFFVLVLPSATVLPRHAFAIALFALTLGGAIELIQPYVGRSREFLDFLADSAGVLGGLCAGKMIRMAFGLRESTDTATG